MHLPWHAPKVCLSQFCVGKEVLSSNTLNISLRIHKGLHIGKHYDILHHRTECGMGILRFFPSILYIYALQWRVWVCTSHLDIAWHIIVTNICIWVSGLHIKGNTYMLFFLQYHSFLYDTCLLRRSHSRFVAFLNCSLSATYTCPIPKTVFKTLRKRVQIIKLTSYIILD